jgi:hypothetical protein
VVGGIVLAVVVLAVVVLAGAAVVDRLSTRGSAVFAVLEPHAVVSTPASAMSTNNRIVGIMPHDRCAARCARVGVDDR